MRNKSFVSPGARLVSAREKPPENLEEILRELGAGNERFRGTSFGRGECELKSFLQQCCNEEDPGKIAADFVPQTTFWLVNAGGEAVGIVRVRHRLSERLLQYGGNIGYYIRPAERGKGYGKEALRLALEPLRRLKVARALLTVNPANAHSIRAVLANGGVQDSQGVDPVSKEVVNRYWIEL